MSSEAPKPMGVTLRESLREMAVVVVSILIAFGLDATWDDREQRARETRMLRSTADDMAWNIAELDANVARHREVLDASKELLASMGRPPGDIRLSRFDSLLTHTVNYWTYDPRVGSVDALLRDLDVVSEPALRSAIASWPETLRDFREDEERGAAEVDEQILPALQSLVPLGVNAMDFGFGEAIELPATMRSRLTVDAMRAVLGDLYLANEIAARAGRQVVIISEADDLRSLMLRIIELIEDEVGD